MQNGAVFVGSSKTWAKNYHVTPPLGIYPKELKTDIPTNTCTHIHSSIIHSRQKVETAQMSISGIVDTQSWGICTIECSVQSLSHVWLFSTLWTAACQASLSIANSQSLLKLLSIESVLPSNHLILRHPFSSLFQSFPASRCFPVSWFFTSGGQSIGVSASASVLPMNIQDWFPLGWTGWISLRSQGLSRVFSNTTVQKHQFFSAQLSLQSNSHIRTWLLEQS